jgi:hypothetical protein
MLINIVVFRDNDSFYRYLRTDGSDAVTPTDEMLRPNETTGELEWMHYSKHASGVPQLPARRRICGATSVSLKQAQDLANKLVKTQDEYTKLLKIAEGMI